MQMRICIYIYTYIEVLVSRFKVEICGFGAVRLWV